jgi:hypothetical protein
VTDIVDHIEGLEKGLGSAPPVGASEAMAKEVREQITAKIESTAEQMLEYQRLSEKRQKVFTRIEELEGEICDQLAKIGHPIGVPFVTEDGQRLTPAKEEFFSTPRGEHSEESELIEWLHRNGFGGKIPISEVLQLLATALFSQGETDLAEYLGAHGGRLSAHTLTIDQLITPLHQHFGLVRVKPTVLVPTEKAFWNERKEQAEQEEKEFKPPPFVKHTDRIRPKWKITAPDPGQDGKRVAVKRPRQY